MTLLTAITALIFFMILRTKISFSSYRSIITQVTVVAVLFATMAINIFYNWGYFKQYTGPHDSQYNLAQTIHYSFGHALIFGVITLFASVIDRFIKERNESVPKV
jgi:hypothetical protein